MSAVNMPIDLLRDDEGKNKVDPENVTWGAEFAVCIHP